MIRQAISCDICGTEKKQTNNWFVAHEQAGELRVTGWNSRNRLRAGSKHLCGQTCLHKLVDEFMARTLANRTASPAAELPEMEATLHSETDTSLTSKAAYEECESSARLITPATPAAAPRPMPIVAAAIVPLQPSAVVEEIRAVPPRALEARPSYPSRQLRGEAWEREREREMRGTERHAEMGGHRRKSF